MVQQAKRNLTEIETEIAQTRAALSAVKGTETEVYARIVGYYRSVRNWNKGKREEYDHRKLFEYGDSTQGATTHTATSARKVAPSSPAATTMPLASEKSDIAYYELYVRQTCPNCPPVKEYMANLSYTGTVIDVDSESGFAKAAANGVMAAPTVVVYGANGAEIARAHTTQELSLIFESEPVLC